MERLSYAKNQIARFFRILLLKIQRDECPGLAAEMAYHLMLALFPMLIFVFTLFGLIGNTQQVFPELMRFVYRLTPPEVTELLRGTLAEIFRGSTGELAVISFLGAFWAASNGAYVVMRALNRAYDAPGKGFIRQRARALLVTVGLGALLLLGANMLVFGDILLKWLVSEFSLPGEWAALLFWVRWISILAGVTVGTSLVYAFIPHSARIHWSTSVPGALVFIGLWFVISSGFSLYVENMWQYNQVYGAMGAMIVLMVWLYLTSFALLIGAEVNGILNGHFRESASPR